MLHSCASGRSSSAPAEGPSPEFFDRMVQCLQPPETSTAQRAFGILQIRLERALTDEEAAQLMELARRAEGTEVGIFLICEEQMLDSITRAIRGPGDASRMQIVEAPRVSGREIIPYIEATTALATKGRVKWTHDSLLLAAHYEAETGGAVDSLIRSAISIAQGSAMPLVTTWCVRAALERAMSTESLKEPSQNCPAKPPTWPDQATLSLLERLRLEWQNTLFDSSGEDK